MQAARGRRGRARRIHAGDGGGIEGADAALELERARKGFLHRHLLIEDEANEERERLLGEERVGLVIAGEVEAVGSSGRHRSILARPTHTYYFLLNWLRGRSAFTRAIR